jgi:hypothetical protein
MGAPRKERRGRIGSAGCRAWRPVLVAQGAVVAIAGIESLASAPCSPHQSPGAVRAGRSSVPG